MDYSTTSEDELGLELEALKQALNASLGGPFDGREEKKTQKINQKIEMIESELFRRRLNPEK